MNKATEIIRKYFPYYEEEFTEEYKRKLHACMFEYADYIATERLKNISSNTMLADEVCEHDMFQPTKDSPMQMCKKCQKTNFELMRKIDSKDIRSENYIDIANFFRKQ